VAEICTDDDQVAAQRRSQVLTGGSVPMGRSHRAAREYLDLSLDVSVVCEEENLSLSLPHPQQILGHDELAHFQGVFRDLSCRGFDELIPIEFRRHCSKERVVPGCIQSLAKRPFVVVARR